MRILLLGGTGFLGRAIAFTALGRGHKVVCLARGNGGLVDGVQFVQADRDKADALLPVSEERWDTVIDLARHPIHAKRAVSDLNTEHWIFISTSSVYSRGDILEQDESAPLLDPLDADFMADMTQYGGAKVACEGIYRESSPSYTIIRPGLIGGNEDHTGRSGYYPWRFAHPTGNDVLVPDLTFPVALIDGEDLAVWIIHCAETRARGTFNAAGDTAELFEVIDLSKEVASSSAVPRVVSNDALSAAGVSPWMGSKSLPLWVDDPDYRYVATLDSSSAKERGLTLRPLRETLASALQYEENRDRPRVAGLTDEEERRLRQLLDYRAENGCPSS